MKSLPNLMANDNVLIRYTHSGLGTDDVLAVYISEAGVTSGMALESKGDLFLKNALSSV
ncbi:hypothetical protein ACJVC5_08235 [Peredibacter sp. HCB2-198]|uniref:hypothetical protein n=1 Tax=Peredibacter sp. HCB2-198 TaxID=3383025 RepID=UPI0038B65EE5